MAAMGPYYCTANLPSLDQKYQFNTPLPNPGAAQHSRLSNARLTKWGFK